MTFFWIAFSVSTATAGILSLLSRPAPSPGPAHDLAPGIAVALLVPICNETPTDVFGNAAAMLDDLAAHPSPHRFDLFILSDTHDRALAAAEKKALGRLRALHPRAGVHYRRRPVNTDRKTGNLSDWLRGWGGGHEGMLVLDADSLMDAAAINALADALSADPSAGIVQSFPQVFAARSLFGRMQQFSGALYGRVLAEGLARWSGDAGNFWGHNAILRTRAFAATAGLPHLRGGRLILSHDFVEAALMRRAGWSVRFLPRQEGSHEEAPQTLVDYVLRDRRWCQGNLQHLRVIGAAGLHPVSRLHMLQGICSYLMAPAWFVLLLIWAFLGNGDASVIRYFDAANPMFPIWPVQSGVNGWLVMGFMYGMLLVPKLMGLLALPLTGLRLGRMGGWRWLAPGFVAELVLSIAYAPVLMMQQLVAVLRTALGLRETWAPQRRGVEPYPLRVLLRFHALETVSGAMLLAGMATGMVSLWLLPIALSLAAAIPLSALSGFDLSARPALRPLLEIDRTPPPVIASALAHRRSLAEPPATLLAAE